MTAQIKFLTMQASVHHIVVNALWALYIKKPSDVGTIRIGNSGVIEGFNKGFPISCFYRTSICSQWRTEGGGLGCSNPPETPNF